MPLPLFHVDAFTHQPFSGNPAAVCLLPAWKDDRWLQAVAAEMNLSETAFLVNHAEMRGFDLAARFTPKVESGTCAATQRWRRRTSFGSRGKPPAMKSASRPEAAS